MQKLFFTFIIFSIFFIKSAMAQTPNDQYDSTLASKYPSDEYGMRMYTFVLLKSGTNTTASPELIDSAFAGHLSNISRLANEGMLILAGPLGDNDLNYRGIFILNADTKEKAQELLSTDPAIAAGLLAYDMYPWYGSAALPAYLDIHNKIGKFKF